MWSLLLAGAVLMGPYSGVTLDNLTAEPIVQDEVLLETRGAALATLGTGMAAGEHAGKPAVVTEKGFALRLAKDLPAGRYAVCVQAAGTGGGNDSFWLAVDGQQVDEPFTIPVGEPGTARMTVDLPATGTHAFELSLREGAGAVLQQVRLVRTSLRQAHPPLRPELAGKHPRLLLTAESWETLRKRADDPRVKHFYTAPQPLSSKAPRYREKARNGGSYRTLGNYALAYRLNPSPEQLQPILQWLETATTYGSVGTDLDAEYFIEGLALTYDWLYDVIPEPLRTRVRDRIALLCREVFAASLAHRQGGSSHYQQNHYWYANLALALGAAAVYGEVPEAAEWLTWAWDRYERIALSFSPDGSFHEGPSYWDFSMPTLYLYTDLYEWCTGRHTPAGDDGLAGQGVFRFGYTYPGLQHSAALEDAPPTLGPPANPCLLWEAKRFQDPVTQGVAQALKTAPTNDRWSLLWLDETLPTKDFRTALPLARYYHDVETAFARTGWEEGDSYLAFVSRPLGGHKWADLCDKYGLGGTGHNHPEQNHFVLFGRGEVLAGDPGYTYDKQTRNHNTVLVDGKGQYGDGEMWPSPKPGRAHLTAFATAGGITICTGDATSAYPAELGLTRFERTVVLAGRDLAVVYDRLAAREPRTFTWLLHHQGQVAAADGAWRITRNQAQLSVRPLLPEKPQAATSTYLPQYVHPTRNLTPKENAEWNLLELSQGPATAASFLVPLQIGAAGSTPAALQRIEGTACQGLRVGDLLVAFNTGDGEMTVTLPWGEKKTTRAKALVARLVGGKREVVVAEGL